MNRYVLVAGESCAMNRVRAGSDRPLRRGELLRNARVGVEFPIPLLRQARPVPDRVCQPEEECAIGMFEVPMVTSHAHRAVLVETAEPGPRRAHKFALLIVQTAIGRIRAGCFELP